MWALEVAPPPGGVRFVWGDNTEKGGGAHLGCRSPTPRRGALLGRGAYLGGLIWGGGLFGGGGGSSSGGSRTFVS